MQKTKKREAMMTSAMTSFEFPPSSSSSGGEVGGRDSGIIGGSGTGLGRDGGVGSSKKETSGVEKFRIDTFKASESVKGSVITTPRLETVSSGVLVPISVSATTLPASTFTLTS